MFEVMLTVKFKLNQEIKHFSKNIVYSLPGIDMRQDTKVY